jgi:thiamine-monophosphate kinase
MLPDGPQIVLGPGDDAAVVRAPDGRVVATTDMLIEGRHFRTDWSRPADIGHKVAARNLADIAAMGARPTALLVAFAGPGTLEVAWVLDLVRGLAAECAAAGAAVAGGDTSSAGTIMLTVTALGDLAGREPVTRSGARPGDVVAVAGTLGSAAAGLAVLTHGTLDDNDSRAPRRDRSPRDLADQVLASLVAAHRRPSPPYDAGPQAAMLGATSMVDVSDGLIADLGHVADASGVRVELDSRLLAAEPPASVTALERAAALVSAQGGLGGQDAELTGPAWLRWVLTGGDDHALAATFPANVALPSQWAIVGKITEGRGVTIDGGYWPDEAGWEHFRA